MSHTEYDDALKELGIVDGDQLEYAELLRYLHTPTDLKYLHAVLTNFISTFSEGWLEDISVNGETVSFTHKSLALSQKLIESIQESERSKICFRPTDETKLEKIFHGELEDYPFYAIYFLINNVNANFFRWLRQVLFAIPQIIKDRTSDEERLIPYEPVFLGLFFRQMTEREEALEWLSEKNCSQCNNLKSFVGWLYEYRYYFRRRHNLSFTDLKAKGLKSSKDVKLKAIALYHEISKCIKILEIPLGHRKQRRTTTTRGPAEQLPSTLVPLYGVTALEGDVIVQLETLPEETDDKNVLYSVVQVQLEDELVQAGEEVFEQQQDEMYIFADQEPMESYVAAFHARRLSKAIMRRIERQHQYLSTSLQCLSNSQVHQLLISTQKETDNWKTIEAALVACICFFTARKPEQITYDSASDFSSETATIKLPAFTIQYANSIAPASILDNKSLQDSSVRPALFLPMPEILLNSLIGYERNYPGFGKFLELGEFCRQNSDFQNFLPDYENLHITPQQLANHLFIKACAMFGSACATLMFNRPAPGSQARLYYTSLSASVLEQRYRQLVIQILSDAGIETAAFANSESIKQDSVLGCRQAPTLASYRTSLDGLKNDLATLSKNDLSPDWVRFHNRFTAYCVVAQGLLTGIRPTHSGFINYADMLLEARVAVVRDKDSADEYHTRTIPLHPVAIKIAKAYKEHIEAIAGRLHRIGMLTQWHAANCPTPFFFTNTQNLDNRYKVAIMPFKPSLLSQELQPHFNLPPNSNRKLLRSELERKAVPAMCIDALLGHANLGETLWHPHATLSLEDVRQTLLPCLNELVTSLGIQVLTGVRI
ncbi:hypothetical protein [Rheinheimera oceanensis]|uniref:hypothetical protein n=1 Tax=Rheinheimera oceanensis TaxID=2817449 RepID=UPI001BFCDC17|nr:hypothetical protein [Rheinheimera oceanensis]